MPSLRPLLKVNGPVADVVAFYQSVFKGHFFVVNAPSIPDQVAVVSILGQSLVIACVDTPVGAGPSLSMVIECETQAEFDYFWSHLSLQGVPGKAGWVTDRFGLHWQMVPRQLGEWLATDDDAVGRRVINTLQSMDHIDFAQLAQVARPR